MNERAAALLADLDCLYWRHHPAQWDDYCLACCIPNHSADDSVKIPVAAGDWFPARDKLRELLGYHGIPLEDFLRAWDPARNIEDLKYHWRIGHMPMECPKRSDIVKVLENLDD